jgi:hypothetical protein
MHENINADYTDWADSLKNTSVICKIAVSALNTTFT